MPAGRLEVHEQFPREPPPAASNATGGFGRDVLASALELRRPAMQVFDAAVDPGSKPLVDTRFENLTDASLEIQSLLRQRFMGKLSEPERSRLELAAKALDEAVGATRSTDRRIDAARLPPNSNEVPRPSRDGSATLTLPSSRARAGRADRPSRESSRARR